MWDTYLLKLVKNKGYFFYDGRGEITGNAREMAFVAL